MGSSFFVKPDIDIELQSTTCTGKGTPSCPTQSPVVIKVNGLQPKILSSSGRKRGFIFVTVNPATGMLEKAFHLDTHAKDVDLQTSMEAIEKPRILLGVVKEDAYKRLSESSKKYLQDTWLGKPVTLSAAYEAYVFIGVNLDVKPVWVEQIRKARGAGRAHLKVKVPIGVRGCINPNDPKGGKANQRRYKFLESASYQCNKDLIMMGIPAKCMVDGSWKIMSSNLPRCFPDDIDECNDGSAKCPQNSKCINTIGSFRCQCNRGYSLESNVCVDVNECKDKSLYSCPTNSYCVNKVGTYECHCNKGYKREKGHCIDVNECENNDACPVNSECINSIGSFQCNCPTGLIKVGHLCVIPDAHQSDWTIALDVLIGIFALASITAIVVLIVRRKKQEEHNKKLREKLLGGSLSDEDWDRDFDPENYFHTKKNFTE